MPAKPELSEIQKWADEVASGYSERDAMFERVEKIFALEDDDLPDDDWIKKTISPDGRNALLGAARLLTATEPTWSVPGDGVDRTQAETNNALERAVAAIWRQAGRVQRKPVHYRAVLSALLYDEVHIACLSTKKLVEASKDGRKLRAEQIARQTPLLFDVISPKICYPVYDGMGLSAHYTKREMKVLDVIARWPDKADLFEGKSKFENVVYNEWWDETYHAVWVEGVEEELFFDEHKLAAIPIASAYIEGDGAFFEDMPDAIRQPFLWTLDKSGLYHAQNTSLTVLMTMSFLLGANPKMVFTGEDREIEIDWSDPGGLVKLRPNEKLEPLMKSVIDPSIREAMDVSMQKGTESTIYRQVLGEPLGSNAPFSMVSLLSQAGRLPLVPYQRMVSWVLADAMLLGLRMLKIEGGGTRKIIAKDKSGRTSSVMDFDPKTVPDDLELICTLDISMPQDERQQIQMANEATQGDNPLLSVSSARERFLKIGQPEDEDKRIWEERQAQARFMQELQRQQMAMEQEMMARQSPQMGAQAPGGMMGPVPPQGMMPPEMMGQPPMPGQMPPMPPGMAQEGLPLAGPVEMRRPPNEPPIEGVRGE
jgi:hypothetical protein